MDKNKKNEKPVEELLLECGAVKFNGVYPFIYKSGMKSPIYCDAKSVAGFPIVYTRLAEECRKQVYDMWKKAGEPMHLTIVGVDGAAAWAAMAAATIVREHPDMYHGHEKMPGVPFSWVLSQPKDHGMFNQIDGAKMRPDTAVIIVENVIKTGGTTMDAIRTLRRSGVQKMDILGVVAVMSYDLPEVKEALAAANIEVRTLTTFDKLVAAAVDNDYLSKSQVDTVKAWHKDPHNWR